MNKDIFKSIEAVLFGFVTVFILSTSTDAVLEKIGVFPTTAGLYDFWLLLLALMYRSAYAVVGGYVTAWFAPNRQMRHVVILGIIGFIFGSLGVVAGWNLSAHWYPIALAVTAFPLVYWGGKLKVGRQ